MSKRKSKVQLKAIDQTEDRDQWCLLCGKASATATHYIETHRLSQNEVNELKEDMGEFSGNLHLMIPQLLD